MSRLRKGKIEVKVMLRGKIKRLLRKDYEWVKMVLRSSVLSHAKVLKRAGKLRAASCELLNEILT